MGVRESCGALGYVAVAGLKITTLGIGDVGGRMGFEGMVVAKASVAMREVGWESDRAEGIMAGGGATTGRFGWTGITASGFRLASVAVGRIGFARPAIGRIECVGEVEMGAAKA